MKEEILNFNLCNKKDKCIYKTICTQMSVRTKITCYCIIDGKVCEPYCDFKRKELELSYISELEEINL